MTEQPQTSTRISWPEESHCVLCERLLTPGRIECPHCAGGVEPSEASVAVEEHLRRSRARMFFGLSFYGISLPWAIASADKAQRLYDNLENPERRLEVRIRRHRRFAITTLVVWVAWVVLVFVTVGAVLGQTPAATETQATAGNTPLPDPLVAGWAGDAVCELLSEDGRHRALRCTFPPGVGHERHFHAPHFGYTLVGGTMRMTDGEGTREVEIGSGTSWTSDGVQWHEVLNVGDTTAVFLIVESR